MPPSLRWLKGLVMALMISLIAGVLAMVWLLVTRLPMPGRAPELPASLQMPAGASPAAVTMGTGWVAVVTTDQRILIFGRDGHLRQEIAVQPEAEAKLP